MHSLCWFWGFFFRLEDCHWLLPKSIKSWSAARVLEQEYYVLPVKLVLRISRTKWGFCVIATSFPLGVALVSCIWKHKARQKKMKTKHRDSRRCFFPRGPTKFGLEPWLRLPLLGVYRRRSRHPAILKGYKSPCETKFLHHVCFMYHDYHIYTKPYVASCLCHMRSRLFWTRFDVRLG